MILVFVGSCKTRWLNLLSFDFAPDPSPKRCALPNVAQNIVERRNWCSEFCVTAVLLRRSNFGPNVAVEKMEDASGELPGNGLGWPIYFVLEVIYLRGGDNEDVRERANNTH